MLYFVGNQDGLDYVDYISTNHHDVDTGAIEGEREDRLYYVKSLKNSVSTSYKGRRFTKKLTYIPCKFTPRHAYKKKDVIKYKIMGAWIRLFGKRIKLC